MRALIVIFILFLQFIWLAPAVLAVSDPRDLPNNKVGMGILSPEAEIEEVAKLVNNNGDWGWVILVIKKSERDVTRWQNIFNLANRNHLIPIVRLATDFEVSGLWQKPSKNDARDWADFLTKLYWPTKNKYVQVYNEVNRATEWGGNVDAAEYANELDATIQALREKSSDFFVLPAPLDLALETSDDSLDAATFFATMQTTRPGIFGKIDGWASHSYPNPAFSASPYKTGRLSIQGYKWELAEIEKYGARENMPVFVTETGWSRTVLDEQTVADNYKIAFEQMWENDSRVVAVTPFIFNYPGANFQTFSFKGHRQYDSLKDLPKVRGTPYRINSSSELGLDMSRVLIRDLNEKGKILIKNTGNYTWKPRLEIEAKGIESYDIKWPEGDVYPGQEATVIFRVKSREVGDIPVKFRVYDQDYLLAQQEIVVRSETFWSRLMDVFGNIIT